MPQKNGNTVAAERRMDLASLFCMIGRHGPAVALAVIAMVSVLAGFVIYRTVRGKRRKAAAADGDDRTAEAERDATVMDPSSEECQRSVESTDVSDDSSSGAREDADVIQSDLEIRHRRAAAAAAVEKKPPPYSPPKSDIQAPELKRTSSDDTEEKADVQDSPEVTGQYAEEAGRGLLSDTYTVAEMVVEDPLTGDTVKDAIEDVHDDNSCLKEPEPVHVENHKENEQKVLMAEYQEVEEGIYDEKTKLEEEESFQCSFNPECLEQTPHICEEGDNDDRIQDGVSKPDIKTCSEEPLHIECVPALCICSGQDEECEEENPDSIDCSGYSSNNHLSLEEKDKNEGESGGEECVDYQIIAPQDETCSATCEQETKLPSTWQEQCDEMMNKEMLPMRGSDWDEDDGLAGEMIEEVVDEDHLNNITAVKCGTHSSQHHKQEVEIEIKDEDDLKCDQDDRVLSDGADQVKEKMLTSDNIVANNEEHESLSVALPCLSMLVKDDNHDNGLSGVTSDTKAPISDLADFLDLPLGCQTQKEDKIAPSLDEDMESTSPGTKMSENRLEDDINGRTVGLNEEFSDQECDPEVQPCCKDQLSSVQTINSDQCDKASVAVDPDTVENVTTSVIVEEISCPHSASINKDQQSDHIENDETRVDSDAVGCSNAHPTEFLMSEEISHPDMLSSLQDQESDHMENNEDFSEAITDAVPVMTNEISSPVCPIYLPSFEHNKHHDNDISPGVGEESGISSLAVSPEVQDPSNAFDMTVGNVVPPVVDCHLLSKEEREAQNGLFADDIAVSVINEDIAAMVFGSYSPPPSHKPCTEHTDCIKNESFVTNEDMFGHEIEEDYHKAVDQFTAQIAANVTSCIDDLKIQTDMKAVIEVVEIKERKVCVEKKENTKAEEEKEEDYEKTEISIMEATMDHNEWITESNYQVLPWLNLPAPSFSQDHTKTVQLPSEECQYSPAVTDANCLDKTDIPLSNDVQQSGTFSFVDENMESNKKVVAVQPMPQNVSVTFRIHYFTQSPYQTVAVTGNHQELGSWKGFIPLERDKDGHWTTVVSLPAESHVEWKFVVLDKGEVCRWEECGNRLLDTGYGDDLLVHKWWGLL